MSQSQTNDEVVVRGIIARITFRNAESGYSVLRVRVPERLEQLTVVGSLHDAQVGMHLTIRGHYTEHPKFGSQLVAASMTETSPPTLDGLSRYLSSGRFPGVGKKTAERLIEAFGSEVIEVLTNTPERLKEIPGIPRAKLQEVATQLGGQKGMEGIYRFLISHHVSRFLAEKIFKRFGSKTVEIVQADPYILARRISGVGFLKADQIASNLGFASDSPQRIRAGLYYALEKSADEGHCYLPEAQLIERAQALLHLASDFDFRTPLLELAEEGSIMAGSGGWALTFLNRAEEFVAAAIAARVSPRRHIDPEVVVEAVLQAQSELKIEFSPQQREAVSAAAEQRLMIVTGGPGCGKTTIIRGLVTLFKLAGKHLLMAAPTGRAAQRMAQVCDHPSSTIHRLLKFDPHTGGFQYNLEQKLICDALIIDEASMLDVMLAKDVLSALPDSAVLILVGDRDQLPSVGPGRVFGDLVSIPALHTVALSKLYRRAQESAITTAAYMINAGMAPELAEPDGVTKTDAYFLPRSTTAEISTTIEKLVSEQIPKKFGFKLHEIVVLTPGNRGDLGTQRLNQVLQEKLNPPFDAEQEIVIDQARFRIGDRVCQRVNNYQIDDHGVFNGDLGTIHLISKAKRCLTVELWDGRLLDYDFDALGQLSLAYALTVHRSQGSEVPCVVLVLHESQFTLLERQLLYTAVTRAKKLLVVVGTRRALSIAAKQMRSKARLTSLRERIMDRLGETCVDTSNQEPLPEELVSQEEF